MQNYGLVVEMSLTNKNQGVPGRGVLVPQYVNSATGGDTVQDIGGYRIHTFTTVGTSTFTPATSGLVEVLVVAGGGGGGGNAAQSHAGGGGGAGELIYKSNFTVSGAASVTVGPGGAGEIAQTSSSWINSVAGSNSSFGSLTANGGGRGGHQNQNGGAGGSGGGGARGVPPGGTIGGASTATTGFGNAGGGSGSAFGSTASAGSGGGAGGLGLYSFNDNIKTPGGPGLVYTISGSSATYAAGGAGGSRNSPDNGVAAVANTGSGGSGGSGSSGVLTSGGNGGSGIVIVRYPLPIRLTGTPLFTQLSPSATSSAVGAFSLRAVNGLSTGGTARAVQVRNGTTSATQDFYADRLGNLLTAPVVGQSLANWLGGATGYVTTWYDQSGRGNDATQGTAANQPMIQRATKGPGYACLFNGTTNQMSFNSATGNIFDNTDFTVCAVTKRTAAFAGPYQFFMGTSPSSSTVPSPKFGYVSDTSVRTQIDNIAADSVNVSVSAYAGASEPTGYNMGTLSQTSGMVAYAWRSGIQTSSTAAGGTTQATTSGPGTLGCSRNQQYYTGEIYEILVFTTSLYDLDGTSTITQIYQNQLSYTGT